MSDFPVTGSRAAAVWSVSGESSGCNWSATIRKRMSISSVGSASENDGRNGFQQKLDIGAERLTGGWFAVAGDPLVADLATALGGRTFEIADDDRALYHAAAAVASNHLVALLGHAQRLGASVGVPADALMALALGSAENAVALGPAAALTGPAARGDEATLVAHRDTIGRRAPRELAAYEAMLAEARRLAAMEGDV